jgi:hypothetical protein
MGKAGCQRVAATIGERRRANAPVLPGPVLCLDDIVRAEMLGVVPKCGKRKNVLIACRNGYPKAIPKREGQRSKETAPLQKAARAGNVAALGSALCLGCAATRPRRFGRLLVADPLGMLDEGVAEHVGDGHLGVFGAAVMGVLDHEGFVADFGQLAAFSTDESSGE